MFIDFFSEREEEREREKRERERDIYMRERHQSGASHMCPEWGLNRQPRYVSSLGIEPIWMTFQQT